MKEDVVDTVRRLGHGVIDMAHGRLKLLQDELAAELDRLGGLLARQILVALLALLTVQAAALVVLAATWDTPWRITAAVTLALLAAFATTVSYVSYNSRKSRREPVFAASIEELRKDRQALVEKSP